ncbi:hypothetical protein GSI_10603 [Ganoderma sinense ZZ0214-1]|uniref:Uncharacterized protein n=1 Tax=Ganoderma sinense ZZ0214-1 TaxID=1077348 RepID=A0A2G8S135_9APHY|nr:hypothetical protein GSI_10603 [Ganoderma sinense ZZ0214-1]
MDEEPLRRPPLHLLQSIPPPYLHPQTGLQDKLFNRPSSSQPLAASSSGASSSRASPAQPSPASCVQPSVGTSQDLPSVPRILPVVTGSQARQVAPFQSLQVPAPSISHQDRCELPPQPIALPAQTSCERGDGRDPRSRIDGGDTIVTAKPNTAPGPHSSCPEALALPTTFIEPFAGPGSTRPCQTLIAPPVSLTFDACARLKDPTDDAVLATFPVVRVLVLRPLEPPDCGPVTKCYEAFVSDGREYVWLAFAPSASGNFGDRDDHKSLQVGSAVKLKTISRLSGDDIW